MIQAINFQFLYRDCIAPSPLSGIRFISQLVQYMDNDIFQICYLQPVAQTRDTEARPSFQGGRESDTGES